MIEDFAEGDPSQRTLMQPLHRLLEEGVGAVLKIHEHDLLVLRGLLARLGNGPASRDVDGHRLGRVDMFAGIHGGGDLLRVEAGRRLDDDGVEILAFEQPLISVQPREPPRGGDAVLLAERIDLVLEIVGASRHLISAMLLEKTADPGAA